MLLMPTTFPKVPLPFWKLYFPAIDRFGYSDQSWQSYTHKKGNILGKKPMLISLFTYYSLKLNLSLS